MNFSYVLARLELRILVFVISETQTNSRKKSKIDHPSKMALRDFPNDVLKSANHFPTIGIITDRYFLSNPQISVRPEWIFFLP